MRKRNVLLLSLCILAIAFASGCAKRQLTKSELDRIGQIEAKIAKAREMGAKECAPRELAQAIATLDHAKHELSEKWDDQGLGALEASERMADDLLSKTQVCLDMKQKKNLPTISFTATPDSIDKGKCSTLSWTTTEAASASIDGGVGTVPTSGTREVCPESTTTYTITAAGPGGEATSSAMVSVVPPSVPVAFENIYFDFDRSFIRDDAKPELEKVAAYLKENRDVRVLIEGHCDERGTDEYNFALGDRRSQAAKNYLMNLGIDGSRIKTISYGEERPADPGHEEAAWAKNRRDVFVIQK
ncbi:MAG: peptidoglycan-associated lipoprotein Pal [Deltaproteobacteria bacterium]|nr:peptidoglycan-associated lipoprotein Pal [Deltaproteobacteria bacterium]